MRDKYSVDRVIKVSTGGKTNSVAVVKFWLVVLVGLGVEPSGMCCRGLTVRGSRLPLPHRVSVVPTCSPSRFAPFPDLVKVMVGWGDIDVVISQ